MRRFQRTNDISFVELKLRKVMDRKRRNLYLSSKAGNIFGCLHLLKDYQAS